MNLPFITLFRKSATHDERIDALEEVIEHELNRVDRLARERTLLANERTMLAYQRTSISLFLLAVALIQFATDKFLVRMGYMIFFCGIALVAYSLLHFHLNQHKIKTY
jgi:putative membrane protein